MDTALRIAGFKERLDRFRPQQHAATRAGALFSAAVALADRAGLSHAAQVARRHGVDDARLCEIVLQSYLFLGFPRMLIAADAMDGWQPPQLREPIKEAPAPDEAENWYDRGTRLCKQVYAANYERLRDRVNGLAPDIFRWMLLEGYGKVLSRPELNMVDREAAIVACLIVENRPSQLFSHARGALNVGMEPQTLNEIAEDLGEVAGEGYAEMRRILKRLGLK